MPTVSIDSSLYLEKFPPDKQPGPYVRRINGQAATDDEMIRYYSAELERVGGESLGSWVTALAFVSDNTSHQTFQIGRREALYNYSKPGENGGGTP